MINTLDLLVKTSFVIIIAALMTVLFTMMQIEPPISLFAAFGISLIFAINA